jgi:hypothetical protein
MNDEGSAHTPGWGPWIFIALLAASLSPLLFLNLDVASQLASALALPLAVLLSGLLAIPGARRQSGRPVQWRRYVVIGVILVAVVGGVGVTFALWQNFKDIPVSFPRQGKLAEPWMHGDHVTLPVPGNPAQRGHLALAVSITNRNTTGACEQTATVEFTPVLDGRPMPAQSARPDQEVDLALEGAQRAEVMITLQYEEGNRRCAVDLRITKAVLHD